MPAAHPLQYATQAAILLSHIHVGVMVSHQPILTTALKKWILLLPHWRFTEQQKETICI